MIILLVSQILIVLLLELKLQYSCICCCVICALRAKGQTFVLCYHMNNGLVSDKSQEEEHARLRDDTKLQLN